MFFVPAACSTASPLIDPFTATVVTIIHASRDDCLGHGSSGNVFAVNTDIVVMTACRFDTHTPEYAEEEQYILKRVELAPN